MNADHLNASSSHTASRRLRMVHSMLHAVLGLTTVIIGDGLEEIGERSFGYCRLLHRIVIFPAVKTIKQGAFLSCTGLTTVTLGDRLEEIGNGAFGYCRSLERIIIPHAIKTIKYAALLSRSGLTTVMLGDGLEEIGQKAFEECTSLEHIVIPPAVKVIHDSAYKNCSNLTSEKFCNHIEKFVSCEAKRDWWSQGVHEKTLITYCFIVRSSIHERFAGLALVSSWQVNIHELPRSIPTISTEGMNAYFDTIDSKLIVYENLLN